jgi:deoxyadenosine/deoxycytidine kinase
MLKGSLPFNWENVVLVSLSGIPGVGKSTAVKLLKESTYLQDALFADNPFKRDTTHVIYVKEPSDLWREQGWTTKFYFDPERRALAFQFLIFTTHTEAVQRSLSKKRDEITRKEGTFDANKHRIICIVERCMWDQLLFWKVQGVDSMDDDAYMRVWNMWRAFLPDVSKIFFCKTTDIQSTMERVKRRDRREELAYSAPLIPFEIEAGSKGDGSVGFIITDEEQKEESKGGLTLEYQTKLYNKHCEWYTEKTTSIPEANGTNPKCVHLNADMPYHDQPEELKRLATLLADELKEYI